MSRPFESFQFLNRGWDVRLLEQQSIRWVFAALLIDVFMLGILISMNILGWFWLHRFDWSNLALLLVFVLPIARYTSIVYRRVMPTS